MCENNPEQKWFDKNIVVNSKLFFKKRGKIVFFRVLNVSRARDRRLLNDG